MSGGPSYDYSAELVEHLAEWLDTTADTEAHDVAGEIMSLLADGATDADIDPARTAEIFEHLAEHAATWARAMGR